MNILVFEALFQIKVIKLILEVRIYVVDSKDGFV